MQAGGAESGPGGVVRAPVGGLAGVFAGGGGRPVGKHADNKVSLRSVALLVAFIMVPILFLSYANSAARPIGSSSQRLTLTAEALLTAGVPTPTVMRFMLGASPDASGRFVVGGSPYFITAVPTATVTATPSATATATVTWTLSATVTPLWTLWLSRRSRPRRLGLIPVRSGKLVVRWMAMLPAVLPICR